MDINVLLRTIIELPRQFYKLGDKSTFELLSKCGYFEYHTIITEVAIANALKENPDAIDDWIKWSENKRTSSSWYLNAQTKENTYIVGFFPENNKKDIERGYRDLKQACAAFIKNEIETIRLSHSLRG